jgi:hypothetical protein
VSETFNHTSDHSLYKFGEILSQEANFINENLSIIQLLIIFCVGGIFGAGNFEHTTNYGNTPHLYKFPANIYGNYCSIDNSAWRVLAQAGAHRWRTLPW